MVDTQALAAAHMPAAVVVDLIGDLDATLAESFALRLADLTSAGTIAVFVKTRHVAVSSSEGLGAIEHAVALARRRGCSVAVDPGSRRMRAAFAAAQIPFAAQPSSPPGRVRHVMIARHAPASRRPNRSPRSTPVAAPRASASRDAVAS